MAIAHALCRVSCRYGASNNQKFGSLDPDLPIHYTTFKGLRWWLRVVYSVATPL